MNRDRKILLIILFLSLVASLSAINLIMLGDRAKRTASNRELLENQYVKLNTEPVLIPREEIESLRSLIQEGKSGFFTAGEIDTYRLGQEIKAMLQKRGMNVLQYKTLEQDQSYMLEFSVEGSSNGFFSFWEEFYSSGRFYEVPLLSVKNEKKGISSTFRIGYALYE